MDRYDRKARLYPALIISFPGTCFAVLAWSLPGSWTGLVSLVAACGLHILIMQVVRDRGVRVQDKLWELWGGEPAAVKLHWSEAVNRTFHARLHKRIEGLLDIDLPTEELEKINPLEARSTYKAVTKELREMTRDGTKFSRVRTELENYGFRRNLYGCRSFGIIFSIIMLTIQLLIFIFSFLHIIHFPILLLSLAIFVTALSLAGLVWIVTPDFVRRDAERYADALISSVVGIEAS